MSELNVLRLPPIVRGARYQEQLTFYEDLAQTQLLDFSNLDLQSQLWTRPEGIQLTAFSLSNPSQGVLEFVLTKGQSMSIPPGDFWLDVLFSNTGANIPKRLMWARAEVERSITAWQAV